MEDQLRAGLAGLELSVENGQVRLLSRFLELLVRWNRVYNLIADGPREEIVARHLLDSLSVAGAIDGRRILDVGSGAGFPGVPLSILLSDKEFTLLDSSAKRTRFLRQVKLDLGLRNVAIECARIEGYDPRYSFDTIVSRAFSSLYEFVEKAGKVCAPDGRLLAMKGRRHEAELERLPPGYRLAAVRELSVPGQVGSRHLVTVEPAGTRVRVKGSPL